MQMPFKTRVIKYMIDHPVPLTPEKISQDLGKEYLERQCNPQNIDSILMTLMGIGVMKVSRNYYDDQHHLVTEYQVTKYGTTFSQYIPKMN